MSTQIALQPAIIEPAEDIIDQQFSTDIARLTTIQRLVLKALLDNLVSNERKTELEIAAELGIDRTTIYVCRKNPVFAHALAVLTREIIRGETDIIVSGIKGHAQKDWKAAEFLLKYTGEYIPAQQSLNIHANVTQEQYSTTGEAIDGFLIHLGALGWSPDRVAERMKELKAEGAF